ncbi:AAA family ATPase [uncultured Gammaproteobacteria bacterium]
MLQHLELDYVGPTRHMELDFAPRLNVITGDNGLGKSFILDLVWWCLTRTWSGPVARPWIGPKSLIESVRNEQPNIIFTFQFEGGSPFSRKSTYCFEQPPKSAWPLPDLRRRNSELVVYARIDGGFSVFDPVGTQIQEIMRTFYGGSGETRYNFTQETLMHGLSYDNNRVCNGLIADWEKWRLSDSPNFTLLGKILETLSESEEAPLTLGPSIRIIDDVRDIPTIEMPYGLVPITDTSSGMRRILGLAYLLVWAWSEHQVAAKQRRQGVTDSFVFLVDEIEAHLHPRWQRHILPAILKAVKLLSPEIKVQVIAVTHAPLVLTSVEPEFDLEQDKLFLLDMKGQDVVAEEILWTKQGDANAWLTSKVFGLKEAGNIPQEKAILAAMAWMRGNTANLPKDMNTQDAIDQALRKHLPSVDPVWVQWHMFKRRQAQGGSKAP